MDKFENIYRIDSARYKNWDYGSNAYYFVTICTGGRECFFGEIIDSEMVLNGIGRIVETEWLKTPVLRPDMNLKIGEFVVMPNHFHAIVYIGKNQYNSKLVSSGRDAMHCVSTENTENSEDNIQLNNTGTGDEIGIRAAMHRDSTNNYKPNKFGPQSKNLSSIIRGFKSSVTTEARKINPDFTWQTRFHDRIIRDKDEWYAKTNYIKNNPKNWKEDEFNIDKM